MAKYHKADLSAVCVFDYPAVKAGGPGPSPIAVSFVGGSTALSVDYPSR